MGKDGNSNLLDNWLQQKDEDDDEDCDGFDEIEPIIDDIPSVIKPLPERNMAQGISFFQPLEEMV